ncbi:MAG: TetR family transcriptional regulator C-terminal domain-containing protein [Cypionkella sp.]|uniref:TetR family transcriptional regulator C-terminal domain-containing protein n=1 Tax=Cypionkella sp. TaxID=2811411 RepID=UPI002AB9813F|nr:TetR family transcriptional regulator C-terminal domain-containing protein [Cypionkella sp.]MDZ4309540.1 TetR family transcriptional regulator C-terminal domain-containing protein [Cypionkella sp.]
MQPRRPYRRESEERRREDLIAAALDLVAEGGLHAATVRAIADRAGVTPGLIRHYFTSKEELTRVAYQRLMEQMTRDSAAVLLDGANNPTAQLANFTAASVSPPVADSVAVGLWAAFVHDVRRDAAMREIHTANYLAFRDMLQRLIAALPRSSSDAQLRRDAIACNGVIDGLWLEGSILPEAFAPGEIISIALTSVGAILNVDLVAAYQPDRTQP